MFEGKPLCHVTIIWTALVSNTEDSVSSVTLLLKVALGLLWLSAYMLPIGAYGVEARSRQSAPEASEGFMCIVWHCQENSRMRRCGDHTYQAAKALDFDSASNASTITNTISDDNNSNTAHSTIMSTEDDSNIMGPTTRRKWTEWVNRPPTSGSESQNDNESSVRGWLFWGYFCAQTEICLCLPASAPCHFVLSACLFLRIVSL